jgi:signal-transduction protein with cAMP-binding, CBS, and nucleotidyltransferase domain
MNARRVGALLVVDASGRMCGIFTERDVLTRVLDAGRDPQTTTVAQVMTPSPMTVSPETRVADAMELITSRRVRHLPVVDDDRLVGMISIGDLLRWVSVCQEEELRAFQEYVAGAAAGLASPARSAAAGTPAISQ